MSTQSIDSKLLSKMFLAGAANLEAKKEWINELNVFPVPDGDTGTNMTMTIMSAAKEVSSLQSTNDITMEALCKAISSGSLRGARGNSGVILSQLLRGFTKIVKEKDSIDIALMNEAFDKAVETAYKAVMKPKEGTILTVARGAKEKAAELFESGCNDMETYLSEIIKHAEYVLSQTPEMLPVLKQAGVVDSGGQGLVEVLHGAFDAYLGKEVDFSAISAPQSGNAGSKDSKSAPEPEIKFGYCTEFIIMLDKLFNIKHELDFKAYLESIGDSIVVVADDNIVKVHVHTNDPGLAIQKALKYGQLSNLKIDNMRLEHEERLFKENENQNSVSGNSDFKEVDEPVAEAKNFGFVAISSGEGLTGIFKDLGVDYVIEGGQTMNPSTEDIVNAVDKINAKTVFVLPNNKNIIMAANQAQDLVEDKNVVVIPSKTIPQGISAMINFIPDADEESNKNAMLDALSTVMTGEVTYAVRDTSIDNKEIRQGDYMGIGDSGLLSVNSDLLFATYEMIDEMVDPSIELFTIYYGSDADENKANRIRDYILQRYPNCEVEVQNGGQPIYYFLISAE